MIFEFLFYSFVFYLLYRLIFNFILPIYRTTRQVRQGFRDMQEGMRQGQQQQASGQPGYGQANGQPSGGGPQQKNYNNNNQVGEYIDFEEIK